jgi:hypothetical protein
MRETVVTHSGPRPIGPLSNEQRARKGVHDVYEHDKLNKCVPPDERPVPFSNIVFWVMERLTSIVFG